MSPPVAPVLRQAPDPGDDRAMVLLTGATGYVGGRLLHRLEAGAGIECGA